MHSICFPDSADLVSFFRHGYFWNKLLYNIFFVVTIKFAFGTNAVHLPRKNRRKVKDLETR